MPKLDVYNAALRLLKQGRLATLTDNVPARYLLDDVYAGALAYMLEQGQWAFASKSATVAGSASSNRGYTYRHTKPADFVRLISVSNSTTYYPPLEDYAEDAVYWFSNEAAIYVTYVSNDASYGGDLTKWPTTYSKAVEAYIKAIATRASVGGLGAGAIFDMGWDRQQVEIGIFACIAARIRAEQHDALGPGRFHQQSDGSIDLGLFDHDLPPSSVSQNLVSCSFLLGKSVN